MTFKDLQQNKSGSSPASKLQSKYNSLTIGRSKVSDWKLLLERGYSFNECMSLINYLELHRYANLPSTATIVRNANSLFAEAKKDPVACRIPVSQEASDLWESICQAGCDIDPEYVQAALDYYREYLVGNPPQLAYLEPAKEFVYEWFTRYARYGSPRMRVLYATHPKFIQYVSLVHRAMERG